MSYRCSEWRHCVAVRRLTSAPWWLKVVFAIVQLYSVNKRLGGCCAYAVTSRTSRDLPDVNNVFAVTPETGIVYVSRPEALDKLQDENIAVSLFIVVNNTHNDGNDNDININEDYKAEWAESQWAEPQFDSPRHRWLPVANISVHILSVEADYNVTSPAQRKYRYFTYLFFHIWNGCALPIE